MVFKTLKLYGRVRSKFAPDSLFKHLKRRKNPITINIFMKFKYLTLSVSIHIYSNNGIFTWSYIETWPGVSFSKIQLMSDINILLIRNNSCNITAMIVFVILRSISIGFQNRISNFLPFFTGNG